MIDHSWSDYSFFLGLALGLLVGGLFFTVYVLDQSRRRHQFYSSWTEKRDP